MSRVTALPRFRDASPADVDAVVSLVQSAYRGASSRDGWTTEADLLDGRRTDADEVASLIRPEERSRVLLAEDDEGLLACCHIADRGDHSYFGMFAVSPAAQGAGLGRSVLGEAERLARDDWSLPEQRMTVISAREDLIAWYERRGYRRTGVMTPFPYGDERFGIPLRPDLRFEELRKPL